MMQVRSADIPDVLIFEPKIFVDKRGFFYESFNELNFKKISSLNVDFVQDKHSKSQKMFYAVCTIK